MLPVPLDTTPLPKELNEFQWVDLHQLMGSEHRSSKRWLTLSVMVAMLMLGFSLFTFRHQDLGIKQLPSRMSPESGVALSPSRVPKPSFPQKESRSSGEFETPPPESSEPSPVVIPSESPQLPIVLLFMLTLLGAIVLILVTWIV